MLSFPFNNLNEVPKTNPVIAYSESIEKSARRKAKGKSSLFSDNDENQA